MRLVQWFFMLFCAGFLVGCSHVTQPLPSRVVHGTSQSRPLSHVTWVKLEGRLNVNLYTGAARPRLVLHGDPRDLAYVVVRVLAGELRVSLGKGYPHFGPVQVDIYTHYLNGIQYRGAGDVVGKRLRTSSLDVVIDNPGRTDLQGTIGLHQLVVRGGGLVDIRGIRSPGVLIKLSGQSTVRLAGVVQLSSLDIGEDSRLSLYWVKSEALIVRAHGKSSIQLAGVVNKLDVELWDFARFHARYLRARRAFVKTHDHAVAEMAAIQHQHTLASGASDIHFYDIPETRADFMAYNGSVLDMRPLGLPFDQEYNQYNK